MSSSSTAFFLRDSAAADAALLDDESVFAASLSDVAMPRWQRKALAAASAAPAAPAVPTTPKTPKRQLDRFIPDRSSMDLDLSHYQLTKENAGGACALGGSGSVGGGVASSDGCASDDALLPADEFSSTLADNLFDGRDKNKILAFKAKAPAAKPGFENSVKVLYSQQRSAEARPKAVRQIAQQPERILDAPDLLDDYYLNLLDWSSNNLLAVALGQTVYLWNATTGSIQQLCQTAEQGNYVTSVSWIQEGNVLAVGTTLSDVQLWDCEQQRQVRNMRGHLGRVGCLAWNQHVLSSGSRDTNIFHHDVRVAEHHFATLSGHQQEVCGLRWSPDGSQLASGGNDNLLHVWDGFNTTPRFVLDQHTAAVKALAWCPWHSNVLASGGGTADRTIRFWNTATGSCLNTVDTKSQVCSLLWSAQHKELISSHGFSQNQITVWKYPTMSKVSELNGHTSRVLHMAMSPDGQTIVSAAGDETLRFWRISSAAESKVKRAAGGAAASSASGMSLRSIR